MSSVPDVVLNNGVSIPQLGYGVFRVPDDDTERAVVAALNAGYRSIDTASLYGNETGVGRALTASRLARDQFFVTTKVWNDDQGYDSTLRAFDASLDRLGLEHVDLYLIHWPKPTLDRYVETWRALEKLYAARRVRAIGVSNFQPDHLRRLLDETDIVPAVNQIELHPDLQQEQLRRFHAEHGVVTEAWSPLGQGRALRHPVVAELAHRHGRTPAQVVLRWHLQLGNVAIPKSTTPSRIREEHRVVRLRTVRGGHGRPRGARVRYPPRPRPGRTRDATSAGVLERRRSMGLLMPRELAAAIDAAHRDRRLLDASA